MAAFIAKHISRVYANALVVPHLTWLSKDEAQTALFKDPARTAL